MITYNNLKKAIDQAENEGLQVVEMVFHKTVMRIDLALAKQWLTDLI